MSILAAEKRVVAYFPSIWGFKPPEKAVAENHKKITTNSNFLMAIGTSGYSEHHSYIGEFERSENISGGLSLIRNHMERFLLVDNRPALVKSASAFENECIASFYDVDTQTFFTNEFGFNQFSNRTRLHRASDGVKIFCAGSGRGHFDSGAEKLEVMALLETCDKVRLQETLISWMKGAFERVSAKDEGCGAEAMFAIATRESPGFVLV